MLNVVLICSVHAILYDASSFVLLVWVGTVHPLQFFSQWLLVGWWTQQCFFFFPLREDGVVSGVVRESFGAEAECWLRGENVDRIHQVTLLLYLLCNSCFSVHGPPLHFFFIKLMTSFSVCGWCCFSCSCFMVCYYENRYIVNFSLSSAVFVRCFMCVKALWNACVTLIVFFSGFYVGYKMFWSLQEVHILFVAFNFVVLLACSQISLCV